jgi:hypothetical protein
MSLDNRPSISTAFSSTFLRVGTPLTVMLHISNDTSGQEVSFYYIINGERHKTGFSYVTNKFNTLSSIPATVPEEVFKEAGEYKVQFVANNGDSDSNIAEVTVNVTEDAPIVSITYVVYNGDKKAGQPYDSVTFKGAVYSSSKDAVVTAAFNDEEVPAGNISVKGNTFSVTVDTSSLSVNLNPYTFVISAEDNGQKALSAADIRVTEFAFMGTI